MATNKLIENFKESKKEMKIKVKQANELIDLAMDEFFDSIISLAKNASEEEIKDFINAEGELLETTDVIAMVTAFMETHNEIDGVMIFGKRK